MGLNGIWSRIREQKNLERKYLRFPEMIKGERLTFLKVTGGKLVVKMPVNLVDKEEKVNQIRIYSGAKYETVNEVEAGGVCAVTGLVSSYIGQGFGVEKGTAAPFLEPVLTYQDDFAGMERIRQRFSGS